MKPLIYRIIWFSFMLFFFFSDNEGSFATDHQAYAPTASSSYHVLLGSWKERHSLLISWYPEAQLSLFLLVKLLLLTSGCFSHPSLFTLLSSLLSISHTQFIPRFPSIASGQTVDLFVSPINGTAYWAFEAVCLLGNAGNDESVNTVAAVTM